MTKDDQKCLDLKEEQWELLSQLMTVLKPLQMATTVISLEQNTSCSIVYPIIHGLLSNHLAIEENDIAAIKSFKLNVKSQLNERFKLSSLDTAISLLILCSAIDPRYLNLVFLTKQQKEFA